MENKIDILKLKSKMLRISSEDKTSNSLNNSRFTINVNQNGTNIDRVAGYAVKHVSCPNVFFNVPENKNIIQITKQTGNIVYTISITPRQYTLTDLTTSLKSQIDAFINPDAVTVAVDTRFNRLVFSWSGDAYAFTPANYEATTMRDIIGLDESDAQGIFFTAQDLSNPVNLTGETELYIHSKTLNNAGLIEPSGNFAVVDVMPLNVPYGGVAYSNFNDIVLHENAYVPFESLRTLRTIDIVLRNRTGDVLVLPNNFYFNMVLIIYYV